MENLGIDGKLLIAQLINFGIFFLLFAKFISKPFLKFLQQERRNEKDKESLLGKLKKGEEELGLQEKEMRNKIKKERNEIIEKSKEEGLRLREQIVAEANKDAETLKKKAMKEVDEERIKLHQDVKNKVADLSVLLVEKTLQQNLDENSKKRITQSLLKNLPVIK
ncbi:ATP synthase F0 subunit B [Candidatus Roizmanbacteria bacterium RIFCSPHIGHO2_01_FULL_39_8]|uniref:ATP synthase subunit b n=3 Tax=Candidatus Roizmaniibacteriota TaxID=1752723 RepID=A0A1F7GFC4_9BACT|nr:MAG: ATP synthase F0 subunit B [Candidatus Roizmanbacteria bacterium RIFCSPHIGHO2_01_FULL_39_8]OGK28216.1 MAG: ATP synthase F0 subunit B [Candidatus Roizmanbacteria bacterium RIFCSPHIGHO2_02_FULL_39_9]OGK35755.1 MAG: ATP synthase F0 subunit B [Candidatus Roizmanbacteria bacterium RIFCSPHIGHO2_12_FULL_39_8]